MEVNILREANRIVVDTTDRKILELIAPKLIYKHRIFHRGLAKWQARQQGRSGIEVKTYRLFDFDKKKRLATSFGFFERIRDTLVAAKHSVNLINVGKPITSMALEPRYDILSNYFHEFKMSLRERQGECLDIISDFENGRISCPPGWGKSFVIACACLLYPTLRIIVTTKSQEILMQRIYPALIQMLPGSVGIYCSNKKIRGRRIMCYTAQSLHHASGDEDIIFFDEGHESAADTITDKLLQFPRTRKYAFSASWDMRLDNKDLRCEGLFGPVRMHVHYQEAVDSGMVVPLEIRMTNVQMEHNPGLGLEDTEKERSCIWANSYRNGLIARDANKYDADTQVLVVVKTLEHALYLKKELPEFTLVYNSSSQTPEDWDYFRKLGLIEKGFKPLKEEEKLQHREDFEKGILKKVIVTPVWNVGVDMVYLKVVVRADAGGSPINDTQIPGRCSRIVKEGEKEFGIIHDYLDMFNTSFLDKSYTRRTSYLRNGWKLRRFALKRVSLSELLEWEIPDETAKSKKKRRI